MTVSSAGDAITADAIDPDFALALSVRSRAANT